MTPPRPNDPDRDTQDSTTGPPPAKPLLTDRESDVLELLANGRTNGEIGRKLYLSEDTVKTHMRRLFRKIGARDRAHAVHLAHLQGLL